MNTCPCGSNASYELCCEAFISSQKTPTTPLALMRSRYTAYTQANMEYIARTMKAPANKGFDPETGRIWAQEVQWQKLEVISTSLEDTKGFVEFMVFYTHHHKHHVMHEISEFHLINNQWFYVDGNPPEKKPQAAIKVGRNDPCSCGSNKKYKKCCGSM